MGVNVAREYTIPWRIYYTLECVFLSLLMCPNFTKFLGCLLLHFVGFCASMEMRRYWEFANITNPEIAPSAFNTVGLTCHE